MNQTTKFVATVLMLMAMAFFAGWPFWSWIQKRAASDAVRAQVESVVKRNPQLQLAMDVAMQDGVLSTPEAKLIVESTGAKLDE